MKELQSLGLAVEAVLDTGETIKFGKDEEKVKAPRIENALMSATEKSIEDDLKNVDKLISMDAAPSNPFAGLANMDLSWNTVAPKPLEGEDEETGAEESEESENDSKLSLDNLDALME